MARSHRSGLTLALGVAFVACAHSAPPRDDYPKAYAGASSADALETALAFAHRTVERAREHHDTIQLACLRDKESKLETLRAERASLAPDEVDARARRLQAEAERCVGGR